MGSVPHFPVATPLDWDLQLNGCGKHGDVNLMVQGPRPIDLVVNPSTQINSVTRQMARVEGLTGSGLNKCLLALGCPETLKHRKVHIGDLDGTLNHLYKVRVHPSQALLGAWAKGEHDQ
jgi:hypothetical protein